MERIRTPHFLLYAFWTGWRLAAAWTFCLGVIFLLGAVRISTDAEFAFASLALLPVLGIAWIGGRRQGLLIALLATAMWIFGDMNSDAQFSARWVPWANAATRFFIYGLVAVLAAQVRVLLEREHNRATQDDLTGMQNRRAFLDTGVAEAARSKRYAHPLAVAFLDLDDFKQLNDAKGHAAGDAALRATAKALLGAFRSSDRIARLGGDEFAILLPEIGYDAAIEVGRRVFATVNDALQDFAPVKASLGIAWFGEIDRPFPAMLKAADELMYEVKQSGKNNFRSRRITDINTLHTTS